MRPDAFLPSVDELIGPDAAEVMRSGIPDATEVVLDRTGHMFRFTHPETYATAIEAFLIENRIGTSSSDLRVRPDENASAINPTSVIGGCRGGASSLFVR